MKFPECCTEDDPQKSINTIQYTHKPSAIVTVVQTITQTIKNIMTFGGTVRELSHRKLGTSSILSLLNISVAYGIFAENNCEEYRYIADYCSAHPKPKTLGIYVCFRLQSQRLSFMSLSGLLCRSSCSLSYTVLCQISVHRRSNLALLSELFDRLINYDSFA